MSDRVPQIIYVIPCGGAKLDHAAPVRDLYTGQNFRHALRTAEAAAAEDNGRVLVMSALHGLVELDTVLEPYDVTLTARTRHDVGISPCDLVVQAYELGLRWRDEVYTFLPAAYLARLDAALKLLDIYAQDVYEADAGIGYQRGTLSIVHRSYTEPATV